MPTTDPALVAAGSTAAEALIAASSPVTSAQAFQASGMPVVAAASAASPTSRYAGVDLSVRRDAAGNDSVYFRRRFVPPATRLAMAGWQDVGPGDRADLIAARALGDPTQFWQLCDANGAFDADELEVPGRTVRVALPEGFPGAGDLDG